MTKRVSQYQHAVSILMIYGIIHYMWAKMLKIIRYSLLKASIFSAISVCSDVEFYVAGYV